MLRYILFTVLIVLSAGLSAQHPGGKTSGGSGANMPYDQRPVAGSISGRALDSLSGEAIEFATVTLYLQPSDSIVGGALSNEQGRFYIEDVRIGRFRVEVNFMGYQAKSLNNIGVSPRSPMVDVGDVALLPGDIRLESVQITEERPGMQLGIDKKIYTISKDLISEGGAATDILRNLPSVDVDLDGNVSLRGSGNVTIFIDGKPSGLTGADRAAQLEQIPAGSIESIEVITNPSAKYDPDGTSGIINVVLKKNRKKGLSGGSTLSAGTGDRYSASGNIGYRNKDVNIFGNYGYRRDRRVFDKYTYRETYFSDTTDVLEQNGSDDGRGNSHLFKAGLDWYVNPKNTLSVGGLFNMRNHDGKGFTDYIHSLGDGTITSISNRNEDDSRSNESYDLNLDWRKSYGKSGKELSAGARWTAGKHDHSGAFDQHYFNPDGTDADSLPVMQNTRTNLGNGMGTLQLDYSNSLDDKSSFETGFKSTIRLIENDFESESYNSDDQIFVSDTALNNLFKYTEQVHAVYGSYRRQFGKFGLQAGLRLEQALTESELITTGEKFENNYFSFFPNVHTSYQPHPGSEVRLSYSRRINRPSYRLLNPFPDYSDPLNLRQGNPFINPEYIHSVELAFQQSWNKGYTITGSVYYRNVEDMIRHFRTVDSSGVAISSFDNLASAQTLGGEFIGSGKFFDWWSGNLSFNIYRSYLDGTNLEGGISNEGWGWSAKGSTMFDLPWDMSLQFSLRYRGPGITAQGSYEGFAMLDGAVKKNLLDNQASISLRVSDIFNQMQFAFNSTDDLTFYQDASFKRQSRVGYLSFTYRFGQQQRKQRRGDLDGGGGGMDENMDF